MSETLASRVKRLVSGSANMIVSTVENMAPEMVMEESIRGDRERHRRCPDRARSSPDPAISCEPALEHGKQAP